MPATQPQRPQQWSTSSPGDPTVTCQECPCSPETWFNYIKMCGFPRNWIRVRISSSLVRRGVILRCRAMWRKMRWVEGLRGGTWGYSRVDMARKWAKRIRLLRQWWIMWGRKSYRMPQGHPVLVVIRNSILWRSSRANHRNNSLACRVRDRLNHLVRKNHIFWRPTQIICTITTVSWKKICGTNCFKTAGLFRVITKGIGRWVRVLITKTGEVFCNPSNWPTSPQSRS